MCVAYRRDSAVLLFGSALQLCVPTVRFQVASALCLLVWGWVDWYACAWLRFARIVATLVHGSTVTQRANSCWRPRTHVRQRVCVLAVAAKSYVWGVFAPGACTS